MFLFQEHWNQLSPPGWNVGSSCVCKLITNWQVTFFATCFWPDFVIRSWRGWGWSYRREGRPSQWPKFETWMQEVGLLRGLQHPPKPGFNISRIYNNAQGLKNLSETALHKVHNLLLYSSIHKIERFYKGVWWNSLPLCLLCIVLTCIMSVFKFVVCFSAKHF